MTDIKPGHPDELVEMLRNWLREAQDPIGSLPSDSDPIEWAVRRFVDTWKDGARIAIDGVEENLYEALALCDAHASHDQIKEKVDSARERLQLELRNELGLYEWNRE